jgi:phosphoserine phosphatase
MEASPISATPLAVDLDGTLIHGDVFLISVFALLRKKPLSVMLMPLWLLRGRAYLKRRVAQQVSVDPAMLNYRVELLEYIRQQHAAGRHTVLATGSDAMLVAPLVSSLACFDEVLASDGRRNCTGSSKRGALVDRFGRGGYDYIGNSAVDIPVWEAAAGVLIAGGSSRFHRRIQRRFEVIRVFP